jgi:hypothetical protein
MRKDKRIFVNVILALVMVFTMAGSAYAAEFFYGAVSGGDTGDDDLISAILDLYDNDDVYTNSGTFHTGEMKAVKGEGKTIRVWFKNEGTQGATVTLYKCGLLSDSSVVTFSVSAGSNKYKEYYASNADKGTYRVKIVSNSGEKVDGYLRLKQL